MVTLTETGREPLMATKKAVIIGFDGDVTTIEYDKKDEYQTFSDAVDGYIEMVSLMGTQLTMYINEEGKLEGQPFNEKATAIFREKFHTPDYIAGNAIFVGAQKHLDKIVSLFG